MTDVKVCRICLVMDVKIYDLRGYPLQNYFESIIGTNPLSMLELPLYVCFECAAIIKKYYLFRERCFRGQAALYEILHSKHQITADDIKAVDRHNLHIASDLSACVVISTANTCHFDYDEVPIKEELQQAIFQHQYEDNFDVAVLGDGIKEEFGQDYFDEPVQPVSSDDDEPLSSHKRKKKIEKKKDKRVGKRKKRDVAEDSLDINSENAVALDYMLGHQEIVTEKPKRGRKKKVLEDPQEPKEKKKRGPKRSVGLTPDEMDMEEYVTIIKLTPAEQASEVTARQQSSNYMNAPLKCPLCYKGFVDTLAYTHHMNKHSPSSGDIECPICKFRFKTRRLLQKHSANHEKKYSCKSCTYVSKTTTQAKQHQKWHKGVTYKCQHCDEVSTKWTSYLSHVRIKHPSEFICGVCGYSFVSQLGLNMHRTMMHKDVVFAGATAGPACAECGVQFVSEEAYKRHMVTSAKHASDNHFRSGCRVCGSMFATKEELRLHHRKAHARKRPKNYGKRPVTAVWPAKCDHCPEIIENAREYWAHFRRAHPDQKYPIQKAYICEICGKGFRGNAFLVYHKRTHLEERNYKCAQCPKAFYNRTNLQMHEKTHSDHRPYPCDVCFKAFKSKGALDRHYRSHTGVKPYKCEFCGKGFGQSNSRKLHVRTVHLKQPAPYLSRARLERRRQVEVKHVVPHHL